MNYFAIQEADRATIDERLQKVEKMMRHPFTRGKRLETLRGERNFLERRLRQLDETEAKRQGLS